MYSESRSAILKLNGGLPSAGVIPLVVVSALAGCVHGDGGGAELAISGPGSDATEQVPSSSSGGGPLSGHAMADPAATAGPGVDAPSLVGLVLAGTAPPRNGAGSEADPFGRPSSSNAEFGAVGDRAPDLEHFASGGPGVAGLGPGARSLPAHSRDNREAADLLDHWGHRRVRGIVEGLSLGPAAPAADGVGTREPGAAVPTGAGRSLAGALEAGDEVRLLGSRHGVTYGRWTGGPADTLSIEFDLSRAGPQMRYDPEFRALLERAGKAWSRRIADTWPTWKRAPGDVKGTLWNDGTLVARVPVGADGETSARLEIDITDGVLAGRVHGRGGDSGQPAPGRHGEPRFGTVEIDREYLADAGERHLFRTLAHEIGHVLGAWTTHDDPPEQIESNIDRAAGTWTGPNVVSVHGGPAPFQDAANPHDWVNGERSPRASEFDFAHSGVCSSLMAYCSYRAPRPVVLPDAIDFAFLADVGVTLTEETARPEKYGLVGWTDHARFSLAVSRDLEFRLPDREVRSNRRAWFDRALDVTDRLLVEVDTFGYPSFGDLRESHPAAGLEGTVGYAGGLVGAAIDRTGLPPVTGSANLAVNLGTFDGTASFTSLAVHADGSPETFAGGSLHYPFNLTGNAIVGSATGSTLEAGFFGPGHESVAGTLHDPFAGLLASFGAAHDDRPSREDVVASADYLAGRSYGGGVAGLGGAGWSRYRCDAVSGCASREIGPDGWSDWTQTSRAAVLAATAGWRSRGSERLHADHDFVRIARQSATYTGNPLNPRIVESQTGTLEYAAFGSGFEWSADFSALSEDAFPVAGDDFGIWAGVQGTLSGARPDESASWSGPMLGYQEGRRAGGTPFVEGLASVEFSYSDSLLDVAFSEVTSRDGERDLPDFAFEDLSVEEDGTFGRAAAAGTMDGALFGPSHEEVAGAFHHETADVIGSFGARRVPAAAAPEEGVPAAPPPPVVELRGESWRAPRTSHVGAGVAAARDELAAVHVQGGVSVSSGEVRDGDGAERVIEYLRQQIDEHRSGTSTVGLPTLPEAPSIHLAEGTSEEFAAYVEHAVQLINASLPGEKRIVVSSEPAPPLTALADVPDGQVFIDFAPSADDWELGDRYKYRWSDYDGNQVMVAEVDPVAEYDTTGERWEYTGMRAGRIWFDREVLETNLNTAWVWDLDTGLGRTEPMESRPAESDTVRHHYPDEYVPRLTITGLLRALGLLRRVDADEFPDSFLRTGFPPPIRHLPGIDGDALLAAYDRLSPGTLPEDLTPESLGPWDDTSFHLRGDLEVAGGEGAFGVAFRNGFARPWAAGTAPLAPLADNTALFGSASWNGALLGVTPAAEAVAGDARLTVELRTLDAELAFTGLERWGVEEAPGGAGSGTSWGDGDLEYAVAIRGNSFHRTGGDDGEVAGAFFGPAHEAMGGVLERSDLSAGFGGVR